MSDVDDGSPRDEWQGALGILLAGAARRLSGLTQPVVVAACPNKHDDTGRFPDWLGVQVGRAMWERADYGDEGDVTEEMRNPDELHVARAVLSTLQEQAWRSVVNRAFGISLYDEVLALIYQHDAAWLLVSATSHGKDAAFVLDRDDMPVAVGVAARLDGRLGWNRPLLLQHLEADAWPVLRRDVPCFPIRQAELLTTPEARVFRARFAGLLREASDALSRLRTEPLYVAAADRDPDHPVNPRPWRTVAFDGAQVTRLPYGNDEWYESQLKKHPTTVRLDHILDALEAFRWRDLFARGVMKLPAAEPLGLLLRAGTAWVIAGQSAVFATTPDNDIVLVGACDTMACGSKAANAIIYAMET